MMTILGIIFGCMVFALIAMAIVFAIVGIGFAAFFGMLKFLLPVGGFVFLFGLAWKLWRFIFFH